MPRYNIEHKGKYYIFSSICDGIIEEFNTFEELQEYRKTQYGLANFDNEKSFEELRGNKMELKEVILSQIVGGNESNSNIIKAFSLLNQEEMIEVFKDFLIYYKEDLEETK